jgi:UDP-N-acetyl-D-mannosaminuronate dehydrogenase
MQNATVELYPPIAAEQLRRLDTRTAKIAVVGLGYVGLTLSLLFSDADFPVTGFDIDKRKVEELEVGRCYILRTRGDEIENARKRAFRVTSDFAQLAEQDAIILCVPTPLTEHHEPYLSFIENTAISIAPWSQPGQLVGLESTSVPDTAEDVLILLLENVHRCVNIALVNELKVLSLHMGIVIWEVIDAAATKSFGFQAFYPGPGLDGDCILIDPFYLLWKGKEYDFPTRFIELSVEISPALNEHKRSIKSEKRLLFGMSYKKNDLQVSPSLRVLKILRARCVQRPVPSKRRTGRCYHLNKDSNPLHDLGQYNCVVIVTDHSQYDYAEIVRKARLVLDSRNATKGIVANNIVRC